jgi:hypothetical protein
METETAITMETETAITMGMETAITMGMETGTAMGSTAIVKDTGTADNLRIGRVVH